MSAALQFTSHPLAEGIPPAWAMEWGEDEFGVFATFAVGEVEQRMRWIPPGTFQMGSPGGAKGEKDRSDNETQHEVTLTRGFWLADTACTQALWQEVMRENPSHFQRSLQHPVEGVSWTDIAGEEGRGGFLARLRERLGDEPEGPGMELPTEAQWEYACRAGTTTPFSFGEAITTDQVNFDGNYPYRGRKGQYRKETVGVATLPPNKFGLYEMHGNVWEWCADWYEPYSKAAVRDPMGPPTGVHRVLRGGSWNSCALYCRSAYRTLDHPVVHFFDWRNLGFRLARGPG